MAFSLLLAFHCSLHQSSKTVGKAVCTSRMLNIVRVSSNTQILASARTAARRQYVCTMTAASAVAPKRKMVKIGTHNGTFHCDEALGCFLLQQTPKFKDTEITRTRNPDVLKDLDIVIDVGGTYDPSASLCTPYVTFEVPATPSTVTFSLMISINAGTDRYDHHQRGFEEVFGHGESVVHLVQLHSFICAGTNRMR